MYAPGGLFSKKVLPGGLFSFTLVYHVPVQTQKQAKGRPPIPESVLSVARIMRSQGWTLQAISDTLGISVGRVHQATTAKSENPPSQSTGEAGSTNPGGSALSVTDDGSKDTPSSPDKATHGGSQ